MCFSSHSSLRSCSAVCRFWGSHCSILLMNFRNSSLSEPSRFVSNCLKDTGDGTSIPGWNSPEKQHTSGPTALRSEAGGTVLALFRKKLGPQRTPGHKLSRRRTQKGNDLSQVGTAAIDAVFGVGSVEQVPPFKDIPDLEFHVSHRSVSSWARMLLTIQPTFQISIS